MNEPRCYACGVRPAGSASRFCSTDCAAGWAERFAAESGDDWCPRCNDWLALGHTHENP